MYRIQKCLHSAKQAIRIWEINQTCPFLKELHVPDWLRPSLCFQPLVKIQWYFLWVGFSFADEVEVCFSWGQSPSSTEWGRSQLPRPLLPDPVMPSSGSPSTADLPFPSPIQSPQKSLSHSPLLHDLINALILSNFSPSQKCRHIRSCAQEQVSPAKTPNSGIGGSWMVHTVHFLRHHQSPCQRDLPIALPAAGMGKSWCFISLPTCGTVWF